MKFNPLAEVAGKRLVIVDDSIVRGSTTRQLVRMLFDAGAAEVHVRVSSPPIVAPCFYGIDFGDEEQLVAAHRTVEEVRAADRRDLARTTSRSRGCRRRRGARSGVLPRLLHRASTRRACRRAASS